MTRFVCKPRTDTWMVVRYCSNQIHFSLLVGIIFQTMTYHIISMKVTSIIIWLSPYHQTCMTTVPMKLKEMGWLTQPIRSEEDKHLWKVILSRAFRTFPKTTHIFCKGISSTLYDKRTALHAHISMSILSGVINNCKCDCIASELGHCQPIAALLFQILE